MDKCKTIKKAIKEKTENNSALETEGKELDGDIKVSFISFLKIFTMDFSSTLKPKWHLFKKRNSSYQEKVLH